MPSTNLSQTCLWCLFVRWSLALLVKLFHMKSLLLATSSVLVNCCKYRNKTSYFEQWVLLIRYVIVHFDFVEFTVTCILRESCKLVSWCTLLSKIVQVTQAYWILLFSGSSAHRNKQKDRQTNANYIYKLQLTTTHKFRRYDDKKLKLKKTYKKRLKNKIKVKKCRKYIVQKHAI